MNNVLPLEKPAAEPKGARFVISAEIDGFPVTIEVEGKAEALNAMILRLKAIGAEPPAKASAGASSVSNAPAGPATCPVHHTSMRPSKAKPGGFFCSKRMEHGEYCPEKA